MRPHNTGILKCLILLEWTLHLRGLNCHFKVMQYLLGFCSED
jgi:hypothetical protein